jgi:hypothetical protein
VVALFFYALEWCAVFQKSASRTDGGFIAAAIIRFRYVLFRYNAIVAPFAFLGNCLLGSRIAGVVSTKIGTIGQFGKLEQFLVISTPLRT